MNQMTLTGGILAVLLPLAACGQETDQDPPPHEEASASEVGGGARRPADPPAAADGSPEADDRGAPRDDLARLVGVYGDPNAQERLPRNFFVDQTCDGRLRFGAMWGDVAPWVMKSLSDTEFEQAVLQPYETEPIRLEFHLDADGRAEGLTHTFGQRSRIRRLGDLPVEFDDGECPG